ncbi:MAG: ribonuclease HII [Parcubacteria bacterium C7867-001]|nr:MAG: ribonuclease HII [Parcubacteria bacterium C7867-001]
MKFVLGVDEAGRGPLAGPVAVGIVCVEEGFDIAAAFPGLNDSKKLSEKKREALFELLLEREKAGDVRFVVKSVDAATIDNAGIAVCVRRSVHEGIRTLMPEPTSGKVFLDGALSAPEGYEHEVVIGGDALIPAIMLASIAAKVARDRLMIKLAEEYPVYGFEKHKGYGTKVHYAALKEHGLSPIHRRSFIHLDRAR